MLWGGLGADIFRFSSDAGHDIITDFTQSSDLIDLSALNIWDISQLTAQATSSGLRLNTGDGSSIELTGVAAGTLTNADFILADAPIVTTTEGGDTITGTEGADFYSTLGGADRVYGEGGDDTIDGGTGQDTLSGGDGNDLINGGAGKDQISGGAGNDLLTGGSDNDKLIGGAGNDVIRGENANDRLYGDGGNDTMDGDHGNDRLWGGNGNDVMNGGAGKDLIYGDSGADTLVGGQGDDVLTGGGDADVFVFADDRTRADRITDYEDGIDIIQIGFYGFTDVGDLSLSQNGDDAVITLSTRDSITIEDMLITNLTDANFDFV